MTWRLVMMMGWVLMLRMMMMRWVVMPRMMMMRWVLMSRMMMRRLVGMMMVVVTRTSDSPFQLFERSVQACNQLREPVNQSVKVGHGRLLSEAGAPYRGCAHGTRNERFSIDSAPFSFSLETTISL
jgi:hypothetical protein